MQNDYFFSEQEFKDIQNSAFTDEQLILLREPTPKSEIEIKKDDNQQEYKSVRGHYMKKRMNLIFGFNYDFEIKSKQYFRNSKETLVEGRLTIRSGSFVIVKEQFGKHSNTQETGNAYKSATTDAFKKCASEIGLCWDIYSQNQKEPVLVITKEESHNAKKITERLEHFLKIQTSEEGIDEVVEQFKNDNLEVLKIHQDLIDTYTNRMKKAN